MTTTLSATIQPIPYPLSGPSIKSMPLQFRHKDVMWDRWPKLHTIFKLGLPQCRVEWDKPTPRLAVNAVPDAPRTQVALLAAKALLTHTQLTNDLSTALFFSISLSSLYECPWLPHTRCRIRHFLLLNLIWLVIAQSYNLLRSLCRASLPSRESRAPPSFVSSANLLSIPFSPLSKSFMMLESTGPKMEPCGTPLVTGHQSDVTPNGYHPLCSTHEPIAHPPEDEFIQLCDGHLVQKDPVRDRIKSFSETQKRLDNWFPLKSDAALHVEEETGGNIPLESVMSSLKGMNNFIHPMERGRRGYLQYASEESQDISFGAEQ
ncbi:hypothetical protein WISP_22250 [Willisornis vidua]|uniref:Uncharacterized protein n=1 Tax=Willisornis vidua TaxID=1566151 RepID=A0ABQ9DSD1_9PASS|nr:hypothetical protein WISP_22250 [Willisornis vidua]